MRIGPNPTLLRIVMAFGVLFTASCTDSAEQVPLNYGSVQMAERGNHHAITDRATQIWMRVARQAMENGHPGIAIRFAKRAFLASPECDGPIRILALVYRQQSDDDKAVIVARDTPKREAAARTSKAYSIRPGKNPLSSWIRQIGKRKQMSHPFHFENECYRHNRYRQRMASTQCTAFNLPLMSIFMMPFVGRIS